MRPPRVCCLGSRATAGLNVGVKDGRAVELTVKDVSGVDVPAVRSRSHAEPRAHDGRQALVHQ